MFLDNRQERLSDVHSCGKYRSRYGNPFVRGTATTIVLDTFHFKQVNTTYRLWGWIFMKLYIYIEDMQ